MKTINLIKNASTIIIIFFVIIVNLFVFQKTTLSVSAHRSGCHRWHSCPSDSGSYSCGDTGYSNYCGNSYSAGPTLYQQGQTNGTTHANVTNRTNIISNAQATGATAGYSDGVNGRARDSSIPVNNICGLEVKFASPQDSAYTTSFQSSYSSACTVLYSSAYVTSYNSSFDNGTKVNNDSKTLAATNTKKADNSGGNGWLWWVGGLGLFYGAAIYYDRKH